MRTFINENSALVCSVQQWATVNSDGSENPLLIMRQTDYLEKIDDGWKVLHEHIYTLEGWDGNIVEQLRKIKFLTFNYFRQFADSSNIILGNNQNTFKKLFRIRFYVSTFPS